MPDVTFFDQGTVVLLRLDTPAARAWFEENVSVEPWQRVEDYVGVERRYAQDILLGMIGSGLDVKRG